MLALVTARLGSIGRAPGDLGVELPFEEVGVRWLTPLTPGCGVSAISTRNGHDCSAQSRSGVHVRTGWSGTCQVNGGFDLSSQEGKIATATGVYEQSIRQAAVGRGASIKRE